SGPPPFVPADLDPEKFRRLDNLWRRGLLVQSGQPSRRQGLLVLRLAASAQDHGQIDDRRRDLPSNLPEYRGSGDDRLQYRGDLRFRRAQPFACVGGPWPPERERNQPVFLVSWIPAHLVITLAKLPSLSGITVLRRPSRECAPNCFSVKSAG